jgi:hypothetical protein
MSHVGITRRSALSLGGLAALGAWPVHSQPGASSIERSTFDEVWETVRDHFYDRYQPLTTSAESGERLAFVINAMLAELHASPVGTLLAARRATDAR